jgi:hypothetical protein
MAPVDARRLIEELSDVLRQLGLEVRSQAIRNVHPGGVCRIKGRDTVLLNSRTSTLERAVVLAEVLSARDLGTVILSEQARAFLSQRSAARRSPAKTP